MRIVLVNNSSETFTPTHSGAIATWIWECCRAARSCGAEPIVISRSAQLKPYEWPNTVFVDYPAITGGKMASYFFRLQRKLNGWRHMRQKAFAARVAHAVRKLDAEESTLVLHNDPEMAVLLRERFPKASILHHFHNQEQCKEVFRIRYQEADVISSAVSNYTARWVESYYRLLPGSVRTVYNGVDLERFTPVQRPERDKPVVNFCGRTGIEKAPDLLLKAAIRLSDRTTAFEVQILGANHWGPNELDKYQQELNELSDTLQARGVPVRRSGHVPRTMIAAEFQKADIHVVPSRWDEPFGLTTLEGMASGLATVASRTGGTPEVVGEAALLFERDSVTELAEHLAELIANPQRRMQFAKLARQRAKKFTWDQTWQNICRAPAPAAMAVKPSKFAGSPSELLGARITG